jgi:RNAse (barnase) inhibitor barstar
VTGGPKDPPVSAARGGLYRVVEPAEAVATQLQNAGWSVAMARPWRTLDEAYDSLADALSFPSYFGRNLDALWDCLTDLEQPTALILQDWTTSAVAEPELWRRILGVLFERTEQNPSFAVILPDVDQSASRKASWTSH